MSPLKRKRPHDAAPDAPPAPGHDADGSGTGTGAGAGARVVRRKSTSAVTRRATRQTTTVAPQPPPWAADPEPRRRRRSENHDNHDHDENDVEEQAEGIPVLNKTASAASLRSRGGSSRPDVSPPLAPKSVRGRPREGSRSAGPGPGPGPGASAAAAAAAAAAHQPRPVLRPTNQADPALRPKPVIRNRVLRRQQRHVSDGNNPAARTLVNGDANDLVAPMQTHAEVDSAPLRRRGLAVGLSTAGASSQPSSTKTTQKYHPPLAITKTVPIMTQAQPRSVRTLDHIAANTSKPFVPATNTSAQSPPRPATKQHHASEHRKSSVVERNIEKVVFGNICFSTWYHSPYGTEALGEIAGNSAKATAASGVHDGGSKDEALGNSANKKAKEDKLDRLYVCPCCFKYSKELVPWWQHVHLCERRGFVPGEKIYSHPKGRHARQKHAGAAAAVAAATKGPGRKKKNLDEAPQVVEEGVKDQGEWSIWQVDGEDESLFCQNLSLFAKLFLDNKSVFFDVAGFNYFLLVYTTPQPPLGDDGQVLPPKHQVVGFFSKEKLSWDNNNLACILVFPPWQRKGLGALLMGISYEISRREGTLGGPEKPISDLGKKGYKRFWAGEIASWLLELDTSGEDEVVVDVDECSKATWIVPEDCLMMLREIGVVEEADVGPPPKKRCLDVSVPEDEEGDEAHAVSGKKEVKVKDVPRVRVSKDTVRVWVQANSISLEKACDPNGFVEGYAIKKAGVEEEEDL